MCHIGNQESSGLSVGMWVDIQKCVKQLREFPGQVVRMEGNERQLKIGGTQSFPDYISVAVPFISVKTHSSAGGFAGDSGTSVHVNGMASYSSV